MSTMEAKVRPAKPEDKKSLMKFIRNVWGGHDYIPYVWDDWMSDNRARMFVVEVGGVPVGMNRVKFLDDGTAWFEGVRVHPDYRGRGLATMLGDNSMDVARGRGVKVFRLTSSSWNHGAHRQVSRMNFKEVTRISVYQAPKRMRFGRQAGVRKATSEDLPKVMRILGNSKEFALGGGVMWDSYTAIGLTRRVVSARISRGEVSLLGGGIAIRAPGKEGKYSWNQLCFLGGASVDAVRLMKDAFAGGTADIRIAYLPQGSPLIHEARKAGLRRAYSLILFQRNAFNG